MTKSSSRIQAVETTSHLPFDRLLEAGWLLLAVLVPLWVDPRANQPFEFSKAALLRTLVWLMMGVWFAQCLLTRHAPWCDLGDNSLLWSALAVLAAQILATVLAQDRDLSLWGSYERAQGALTTISYVLLFLLVAARLRALPQARNLAGLMVASAAPVVGLGLAQFLGLDPIGLVSDARSSIYATLGRSNFVGAYLAMLLPLTLSSALTARRRWVRVAAGLLAVGELVVVALTLARGAWLATAGAAGVFCLLWAWPRLAPRWRVLLLVAGGLALLGVAGGALWLGRAGGSTAARLTIWRAMLALIARRPVLGYGPDALGLVFPRVYPPELVYYEGRGVWVDRAHNWLLDTTVTTGLVGLLALLALFGVFLVVGWRRACGTAHGAAQGTAEAERRALLAACLAAVVGNLVGNLVSFDVTPTATATWLLMALGVSLARSERSTPRGGPTVLVRSPFHWAAAGLIIVALGVVAALINLRPLLADRLARQSGDRATVGDWAGAITAGERAVGIWSVEPAHHTSLSWAYLQVAQMGGTDPLPWLQKAEAELLAARDLRPADFRTWASLGQLYRVWAGGSETQELASAHAAYRRATELAPHHAVLYTAWGLVNLDMGRFEQAAARFRQAVDLDATDGYAYCHLGDAEWWLGRVDQAMDAYLRATVLEPELVEAHVGLARCHWELG